MENKIATPHSGSPPVVVVGGGFGGLSCARALAGSGVQVTLIDRKNHHLFQPLLYQVATAALSPADIAIPIRSILSDAANVEVLMGEVVAVDHHERCVILEDGQRIPYGILVLAVGSAYNYFGHPEWQDVATSLKTIGDARRIRARLLRSFEEAERCNDIARRSRLMTSVVIGGGPTGVEMAGTIIELARHTLRRDFRHIDPSHARVVLVEAGRRLLGALPEKCSSYALQTLRKKGVEVHLGTTVKEIDETGIRTETTEIAAATVIWAAGIRANPAAQWLGVEPDRSGRIAVAPDLSVPGRPDIYVVGDAAQFDAGGHPLPALAQVAQQQGRWLGRHLRTGRPPSAFVFRNRGDTAVIGRDAAVYAFRSWSFTGRLAWFLWSLVHIVLLIDFEKRVLVSFQWLWRYITSSRGARLID
ncbi:NADH dehydrogenase [Enhydrobacter aerosaccus]|uniref:NADH:ubiquinone reductase (non-electrogenic) n=1 Tax=Enhydrobacter aerosaccus TaxID=225324 RepID=A0A1T4SQ69_9HYPH|nr:NAD(P)/FAD-dependent oxidoreductase [Enhydrobacter aerosaccus]SKA30365.1 NADH dehydrogenase [Enhydrobacter aerosaccus]